MKRVRTADLVPGMMTAEDVYSYNNQMIIPNNMITRLEFYSILAIKVQDDKVSAAPDIATNGNPSADGEDIAIPSYSQRIKSRLPS